MSTNKALQFLDKNDLECSICLEQFTEPKTLDCQHTYCMKCLQILLETHGELQCPKCRHVYALKSHDLENLSSNDMINYLLDFVNKMESEKPQTCANCESPPMYNCSECKIYMCAQCIKQHKMLPVLKGHRLYTLKRNDEDEGGLKCLHHCKKSLELFCTVCNKCACKDCKFIFDCVQNDHKLVSMAIAMEEYNKNIAGVKQNAERIKSKLNALMDVIHKNTSDIDYHIRFCKTAVEIQVQTITKIVHDAGNVIIAELDKLLKEKTDENQEKIKIVDPKLNKLSEILILINALVNKTPDNIELLKSHEVNVTAIKDEITKSELDKTFHKLDTTPKFVTSDILDVLTNIGIGQIITTNRMYKVGDNDRKISVTKDQMFDVKVSPIDIGKKLNLTATLTTCNSTAKQLKCDVQYYDSTGKYNITGTCNMVGDWQMNITAGGNPIEGSPVAISVEALGLVHTISNIHNYKQHRKEDRVTDVMLDTDGCILVSSFSKDLVKFDQIGKFVSRMHVSEASQIHRMHRVDDNHIVYSDYQSNGVVLCNSKFQTITTFGKGMLKCPSGLFVNKETRCVYATDGDFSCILKFNIDNGIIIDRIEFQGEYQMAPYDVTLNSEGHVIVADTRMAIPLFNETFRLSRVFVERGHEDGKVMKPHCVTTDFDGNIIISSNHKLQIFDKNGVFIKRIDHENDGLDTPLGISQISHRPRRVAVANHNANNVKIFNY